MPSDDELRRSEMQRQAAALNHLLGEIGLTTSEQTRWWNLVAHEELGGRTATQAWLAGETEAVTALVREWYERSRAAARRAGNDKTFLDALQRKLEELDHRARPGNPLHRSA